MSLINVISLARKWAKANPSPAMSTSAALCLQDAIQLWHMGSEAECRSRALKSLAYSVGICHPDYVEAAK